MTTKYQILNLDCANCAQKISDSISSMNEIKSANIDFVNKLLYIDTEIKPDSNLIAKIQNIIDSIENGVQIVPLKSNDKNYKSTIFKDLILIFISAIIFICGILLKSVNYYLCFILCAAAIILCGYDIFKKGILSILKFKLDEKSLMTIAAVSAFIIGDLSEGFFVILLFKIGNILEKLAINRSRNHIKNLADIVPDTAFLVTDKGEKKISADKLKVNDIINIHPFERVPADGIVIEGISSMNPCAITGESLPVEVKKDSKVLSGMINTTGSITMKVTAPACDSAAGRILKMIEEASLQKADTENIISRFAKIYTPIVVILALLLCIIPPLLFGDSFDVWFKRALVFLVASCPCAIVISVPLAFYSGVGASSKFGVLFKGSKYIETLSRSNAVVFDKTATLTTGILSISEVLSFDKNYSKETILKLAAAVEIYSTHPIAVAIKNSISDISNNYNASQITELAGFGVTAYINNKKVLCGNRDFLINSNFNMNSIPNCPFYITVDEKLIGAINFSDTIRPSAPETIFQLKKLGIKDIVILSGDTKEQVQKVAEKCDITTFYSKLLPEDKLNIFKKIKESSTGAIFVGDGINDTPTLAAADCGIAMGKGSTAAIETGDVVFLNNSIDKLPVSIKLSRKIMSIVKFNIGFALLIKAVVLILAAAGIAPMWSAVVADTGVTLLSVLNSSPKRIKY